MTAQPSPERILTWIDGETWDVLRRKAEASPIRIAIIGRDHRSTKAVVEYELFNRTAPKDIHPAYERERLRITWPNGSSIDLFWPQSSERLRGKRFDFAVLIDRLGWLPRHLGDQCMENLVWCLRP